MTVVVWSTCICFDFFDSIFIISYWFTVFSELKGYPDPEVVWYKDDQPIKETRHFQIDYEEDGHCSLVISEVCPDDDAKYTCKAVNSLGEATCTAELLVEFMQEEEGDGEGEEEDWIMMEKWLTVWEKEREWLNTTGTINILNI